MNYAGLREEVDIYLNMLGRKQIKLPVDEIINRYLAGESEASLGKLYGVSSTTIHRRLIQNNIQTRNAVEASDLRRHKSFSSDKRLDDLIEGLLLSDAWISSERGNSECRLGIEQKKSSLPWLELIKSDFDKRNIYSSIKERPPREASVNGRSFISSGSFILRTGKYVNFSKLRDKWYPEGKKIIPDEIELSPMTLANWYCGDGSNTRYSCILYTNGFSEKGVQKLCSRLKSKYDLNAKMYINSHKYPIIYIENKNDRDKFISIIKEFVPKCFDYKVEEK